MRETGNLATPPVKRFTFQADESKGNKQTYLFDKTERHIFGPVHITPNLNNNACSTKPMEVPFI